MSESGCRVFVYICPSWALPILPKSASLSRTFSLDCHSIYVTLPLAVPIRLSDSSIILWVHKMAYPYNKQSISILVGTSATALTGALLAVLRWWQRRHVNESLFGRLHWILQLLQLLCGVMSCILAVVSRHRPAVDHSVILSTAGLVTILSNQLGEVSPYSLFVAKLTPGSGCTC